MKLQETEEEGGRWGEKEEKKEEKGERGKGKKEKGKEAGLLESSMFSHHLM